MQLKLMKSLWGMTGALEQQFSQIAEAGYDGIEADPPLNSAKEFEQLLKKYNFEYIAQIHTQDDHIASFAEQVKRAASFNPIMIVSHSAKDSMSIENQYVFFEKALALEKEIGIPIAHETHRGRAMFTPWHTAILLNEFKELKLTADFSHWCCVCESLLENHDKELEIAIERAIHIHGRIGYSGGPQVPHPLAPEYNLERKRHEDWWLKICNQREKTGASYITFTPEYGPSPDYMHTIPFTNMPVTDLWEVCRTMGQNFKLLFQEGGR
ncbi:xylose isomerase [Bacillus sp. M6-12]|uniref:sugar phosphate isomerase/epimerase family protein n=1 Tax=Bacillus sp. M6-12 TaxID=2054166 RepID=UPI000C773A10|nr:TIM barrel protein [Bacillus sp. M6-12]PLS18755.1 xylose isomerase [Bacillus sp. M6-12]